MLTLPQSSFPDFMKNFASLLQLIQDQTQQVFIPIALSHSPVNPKEDMVIVLRTSDNVQCFSLDGWFTKNISQLAKKFVIKTIALGKDIDPVHAKVKINQTLHELYDTESLNLIGGFQDSKGNLQMLMFKEDTKQLEAIEIVSAILETQPGASVET